MSRAALVGAGDLVRSLVAAGVVASALALASPASAQPSGYERGVADALRQLAAGDVASGRDALRELVRRAPERAAGHCHLAEAHHMAGELDLSLSAYAVCARLAREHGELTQEARGLLGQARTLARMEGRLAEAKTAFEALLTFAEAHQQVIQPEPVRSRLEAIEAILAADEAAASVRARREERARELAAEQSGSGASE